MSGKPSWKPIAGMKALAEATQKMIGSHVTLSLTEFTRESVPRRFVTGSPAVYDTQSCKPVSFAMFNALYI